MGASNQRNPRELLCGIPKVHGIRFWNRCTSWLLSHVYYRLSRRYVYEMNSFDLYVHMARRSTGLWPKSLLLYDISSRYSRWHRPRVIRNARLNEGSRRVFFLWCYYRCVIMWRDTFNWRRGCHGAPRRHVITKTSRRFLCDTNRRLAPVTSGVRDGPNETERFVNRIAGITRER